MDRSLFVREEGKRRHSLQYKKDLMMEHFFKNQKRENIGQCHVSIIATWYDTQAGKTIASPYHLCANPEVAVTAFVSFCFIVTDCFCQC